MAQRGPVPLTPSLGSNDRSPTLKGRHACQRDTATPCLRRPLLQTCGGAVSLAISPRVGLLVDRVFGIKALQRMIDMHGRQQLPCFFKPVFQLGQRFGDSQTFGLCERIMMVCPAIAPLAESWGILSVTAKRYEKLEVSMGPVTGMDVIGGVNGRFGHTVMVVDGFRGRLWHRLGQQSLRMAGAARSHQQNAAVRLPWAALSDETPGPVAMPRAPSYSLTRRISHELRIR